MHKKDIYVHSGVGWFSVPLLQMFTFQLSVQRVRCTVLRSLGLILGRKGVLATLYTGTSPWAVGTFSPGGQCESCFPFFFGLKEINSKLIFHSEVSNCLKPEGLSLWALTFLLEYPGEGAYHAALLDLWVLSISKIKASGNVSGFQIVLEQCSHGLLQREEGPRMDLRLFLFSSKAITMPH